MVKITADKNLVFNERAWNRLSADLGYEIAMQFKDRFRLFGREDGVEIEEKLPVFIMGTMSLLMKDPEDFPAVFTPEQWNEWVCALGDAMANDLQKTCRIIARADQDANQAEAEVTERVNDWIVGLCALAQYKYVEKNSIHEKVPALVSVVGAARPHDKLLQFANAADDGQLDWYRDTLSDLPVQDQDFIASASPVAIKAVINDAYSLADALQALSNASWLDADPADTEELAKAKSDARDALSKHATR
jgi:hypothetical protein